MDDPNFYDDYYKKFDHKLTLREKKRIEDTISLIPKDVNSILEVGCGDGRIINPLIKKYDKVCGLDISPKALETVEALKIEGRIENLPFEDNSFDIVLCCEVLEHLPFKVYEKALQEIGRVAKKYIIISVPNNEDIKLSKIRCPYCGCLFHPHRHLRSFDHNKLKKLFSEFKTIDSRLILNDEKKYPKSFIKLYRLLTSQYSDFLEMALCPQCGYSKADERIKQGPKVNFISKIVNPFFPKGRGGWILFLYKKDLK